MVNLDSIPLTIAATGNYNSKIRRLSDIKYIVLHYTSNTNDTAKNNVDYFASCLTQSSAHYFIRDSDIQQSVPLDHAAYAVGLGSMKGPYNGTNPTHYQKCTNNNSVSIEMCGSPTGSEATAKTKQTACELTVELLRKLRLTPSNVIRHYDVTGKPCPLWAVVDSSKWLEMAVEINKLFYGDDEMENNDKNYAVFKAFMDRYNVELSSAAQPWSKEAMEWAEKMGFIKDGKPAANVTRGELATVLSRLPNMK